MSGKTSNGKNYPWDTWLQQGTTRTLRHSRDYLCSDRSMVTYLYLMAGARRVKVMVKLPKPGVIKLTVHNGSLDGRSK